MTSIINAIFEISVRPIANHWHHKTSEQKLVYFQIDTFFVKFY